MANPWLTSDSLIEAVKRKISFPVSQETFDEDDILAFANEEMAISQVPSILQYHEEYLVYTEEVELESNKSSYQIPDRSIGMKLRDIFWKDENDNLFEMSRVNSEDRATWQSSTGTNTTIQKFYVQGNDIVIVPEIGDSPSGSLLFVYYLRPNQLVRDSRAALVESFTKAITLDNSALSDGDTLTINGVVFTAKASGAGDDEFNIGASSILSATALVSAINTNGTVGTASNVAGTSAVVTLSYDDITYEFETDDSSAFAISANTVIVVDAEPEAIETGDIVDFLQTKAGHKTLDYDITAGTVSGDTISFTATDIPENLIPGDYICLANECIIPQIPTDLHTSLAERTCARILSAIGDTEGLQLSTAKIQEMNSAQGSLLDQRVEGAPQKITSRNSLLRYGKMRSTRKW
jgi:hypothetical protein